MEKLKKMNFTKNKDKEAKPKKKSDKKRKLDDTDLQFSNIRTEDDTQVPHAPNLKKRKIVHELQMVGSHV
jgi:hypothetical protein